MKVNKVYNNGNKETGSHKSEGVWPGRDLRVLQPEPGRNRATAKKFNNTNCELQISCWNVRTLLDIEGNHRPERRTALVAKELERYKIGIAALSETRFAEEGSLTETNSGYIFFWKGKPEGEKREGGVGFAVKTEIADKLEELPLGVSDRIMSLRIPLIKGRYATFISVYAPTMCDEEEVIQGFYSDLRKVIRKVPYEDKLVLLGDLNARVGKNYDVWDSLGKHGIGNMNSNGLQLLQLCSELDLIIGNTIFQQKDKYKGTWMHPRSKHWHMIDFIIVRKRDMQDLHSVKVMRGAECWTDHRMVRGKLAFRIRSKFRRIGTTAPKRLNVAKLKDKEVEALFNRQVNDLEPLDKENIWQDCKQKIFETAEGVLGFVKKKNQDWFDENNDEINALLQKKHAMLKKSLDPNLSKRKRDAASKSFKSIKATTQKQLGKMKDNWWSEKAAAVQQAADSKNTKQMYNLLGEIYGPKKATISPLLSKDGTELLREPSKIMVRWCEHYKELLNCFSEVDPKFLDELEQYPVKECLDILPTKKEVYTSIEQLNNGKAPGMDGISAEILKCGGERMKEMVLEVIHDVWETIAPQDWKDAIMVSIFKKGSKAECGNFRGISLLSIVGKVFARILLNRLLQHITPAVIPESQCGFRANRGTVDMIFTARQLQEKCIEQNQDLFQCFIDLTKAFDTVNRKALWDVLLKLGCTQKFTNLVKSLHDGMQARINFNGCLSDPIPVENGVKQGDVLAPTLFAIYFAAVFHIAFKDNENGIYIRYRTDGKLFNIRRFLSSTKVLTVLIRDLLYADDCDLATHTEEDLQTLMNCFSDACKMLGLQISIKKTKVMFQPAPGNTYYPPRIYVDGVKLEVVTDFVYLGSILSENGSLDNEISSRIQKAAVSFGKLEGRLWSKHNITLETKISVYRACILTVLLYASESWTTYRSQIKLLERFHQKCLRHISNIKWQDKIPDTEVLEKTNIPSIEMLIFKARLRWTGHLVRMEDDRIPKQLFYGELKSGKRKASKPKLRFKDCLKDTLKKACIEVGNWEKEATNRSTWRKITTLGVEKFEASRIQHCSYKRAVRKGQCAVPAEGVSRFVCEVCGRICLSLAGLKSHKRRHDREENGLTRNGRT